MNNRTVLKKDFIYSIGFITFFLSFWISGLFYNINLCALLVYVTYIYFIYKTKKRFFINYFWLFTMSTLNIVGVFVCEFSPQYINELRLTTYYSCSLVPLIILYVVLFVSIDLYDFSNKMIPPCISNIQKETEAKKYNIILLIGIVIACVLFIRVANQPYFALGLSRIEYLRQMASWERSLKSLLPTFIPVAMMCIFEKKNKLKPIFFLFILGLYYFWTGDKFGNFFFAFYVIVLCYSQKISEKVIKKVIVWLVLFVIGILLIVYIQQLVINGVSGFKLFSTYLQQRLLGQGEVWWSVYSQLCNQVPHAGEFYKEMLAMLPFNKIPIEQYGQWKMMQVADHYSYFSLARIKEGIPFTATSTASIYYYLGFGGSILAYVLIGLVYGKLIRDTVDSFNRKKILESMICVKLIFAMNNLLFASDLYICSYKGLIYLFALLIVKKYRFKLGRLNCFKQIK